MIRSDYNSEGNNLRDGNHPTQQRRDTASCYESKMIQVERPWSCKNELDGESGTSPSPPGSRDMFEI